MPSVKLDKVRQIRFDFEAFIALEEVCKTDIQALDWRKLTPVQVRDLVWVGQLHTAKPLDREKVGSFLPTNRDKLAEVKAALMDAVMDAYGIEAPKQPDAETPGS